MFTSRVVGYVLQTRHIFDGLWTLIAIRTISNTPNYSVYIYEREPPFAHDGNVDPFCVPRVASGFGALELR